MLTFNGLNAITPYTMIGDNAIKINSITTMICYFIMQSNDVQ